MCDDDDDDAGVYSYGDVGVASSNNAVLAARWINDAASERRDGVLYI